ncbi:hypothetical protein BDV95DRAFT_499974 [Massariosphaeria phaeospora]|uniref:Uncharacterized protein n=1 Tax=Massariosphaeria phaeospora TaxID=100035 RepID=A0A7C8MBB1_9PLEO|nr:hypothetical protein BDV95DRAFT_499974 [Massariosphaeria phaeospora]
MHRKNPISVLVYSTLFPSPSATDPPSFSAHLSKNLVGEVRIETATFYGSLDTIEARYPGLNYAHAPHRKRLGRFPHHRKLFDAFDRLGLTDNEILGFCRWEGTLWARERYERDEGVKVRDTTGMEIGAWVDRRSLRHAGFHTKDRIAVKTDIEVAIEDHDDGDSDSNSNSADDDDDDDDDQDESVGFALNQRLLHAAAMRDQGANVPMDPEWEQYLKEAQEAGELNIDATRETLRIMAGQLAQVNAASLSPSPPAATAAQQQAFPSPAAPA